MASKDKKRSGEWPASGEAAAGKRVASKEKKRSGERLVAREKNKSHVVDTRKPLAI